MPIVFKNLTIVYIIFLAAVLGATLYAGIVVAPVTFNTDAVFNSNILSQYQEGMIMTENFVRLSYVVTLSAIAVFLYEGYKYKMGERDIFVMIAALLAIITAIMFSYYYIPDIISMQRMGEEATKTQYFINTHNGSEIDFKIYAFALLILLVKNLGRALK
jgi:hypothetical protein